MNEKGTIIVVAIITISIIMVLSGYLLSGTIMEMRISKSVESAEKAYYFAEGGIKEAIWKLENDSEWRDSFVSEELNTGGSYWSDSFNRDLEEGSYTVTIENTAQGRGEIIAVAEIPFMGRDAKRKIKTTVFRGIEGPTDNAAIFSGGHGSNINISHSNVRVNKGNFFSNHNLIVSGISSMEAYDNEDSEKLEGQILSTQNISISDKSEIVEYTAICSRDMCTEECLECPPEEMPVPMVDFDSNSENSFLSRAEKKENTGECAVYCDDGGGLYLCSESCVFSPKEFDDLLWEGSESLILENEVTYVTGGVEVKGGRSLEINGVLVADKSIKIGERESWKGDSGLSGLKVHPADTESPAGILSKRSISFGNYFLRKETTITGVIYAGNSVDMTGVPYNLHIIGGVMGRMIKLSSLWEGLEITLDNEVIMRGLGYMIDGEVSQPEFSPVIQIDHWEEVY